MADATTTLMSVEAGNPKTDPSSRSRDYDVMLPYFQKIEAILGGQDAIHLAGEIYLPRFQEEKRTKDSKGMEFDPYLLRLAKSPFTNLFEDIVRNLSSKPFAKELTMKGDTEEQYKQLAQGIDAYGRSMHVFANELFKAAVAYSITWLMVDFTRAQPRADGMALTKADESAQKLRPYWCHVHPLRMIAVYSDYENGVEIITHARILEQAMTRDGYKEMPVERVRVLDREPIGFDIAGKPVKWGLPTYRVWEEVIGSDTNGKSNTWIVVEEGAYSGIDVIPLIPIITGDRVQGSYVVKPPLQGLANMQVVEYNEESNLQWIIDMTCFPMLSASGVAPPAEGEPSVAIGPRNIVFAAPSSAGGPSGSFTWIEPGATSVKVVMDKLEKTRTEMRDLGMQPLTQSNLTVITTGAVAVKANSAVQAWAIRLEDALEQAWKITAQWMGDATAEPEVVVFKDFAANMDDGKGFEGVMKLRTNKDLSREAAVNAGIRYGYLPDDFDIEKDAELIAEEQQGLQSEQTINPLTGLPLNMTPALPGQKLPPKQPPPTVQ